MMTSGQMAVKDQSPALAHTSGVARPGRPKQLRCLLALWLGAAALLPGCGSAAGVADRASSLAVGRRAGFPLPAQLAPAALLARRFATAYAADAYRRRPPALPGEVVAVRRQVGLAARRVPNSRRVLRPRLTDLRLELRSATVLGASAQIADSRNSAFSVAFTVARRAGRWRVVSISTPE